MNTIKVGIVGTGFSAQAHIEALRRIPLIKVWGIAGSSEQKSREAARKHNIPMAYASADELLADPEIRAVHNCTPNALHYEVNRKALLAGKHLLSEKPLAVDSSQTSELMKLAAEADVISGVCFNYRHYPMVSQVREMLHSDDQGRVNLVYGGYLQDWLLLETDYSWRLETEVNGPSRAIADIGSHWCDTIQYVLKRRITEVMADFKIVHPTRLKPAEGAQTFAAFEEDTEREEVRITTEDYASVLIHLEGGVQGVFTVSQVAAGRKNHLHFEISTDSASFAWDQESPNQLWVGKREQSNEQLVRDPELLLAKSAALAHYPGGHQEGWPDGLKNLCSDFYQKVSNPNCKSSFATLADGHRIMVLIEAILESARERKWVSVPY